MCIAMIWRINKIGLNEYYTTQIAGDLEAGIEGAIHTMRVLFEENREE